MKIYFSFFFVISGMLIMALNTINPVTVTKPGIISCGPSNNILNADSLEDIITNDNRIPAGKIIDGVYHIDLEARTGEWFPESQQGSGIRVYAFAEKGKAMQLPGPLVRVPQGTEIHATITNNIKEHALILFGFCTRPGKKGDSIVVQPGETKTIQFNAGVAGTYLYRAYATDSLNGALPWNVDSQLSGAFIVDAPDEMIDPDERIFVIGVWNDSLNGIYKGGEELSMNGLSWPFTERLTYTQHVPVHWRIINASYQQHPMHLHGFFFHIDSRGTIDKDVKTGKNEEEKVVTESMDPLQTMRMTWVPERDGNWLFHCHLFFHIMPTSFLRKVPDMYGMEMNDVNTHADSGMGGLIMGIHVNRAGKAQPLLPEKGVAERQITMVVHNTIYNDTLNGFGLQIIENGKTSQTGYNVPGPPVILYKDEPVAIKVINQLPEYTTIHWHGMQIESYYDGVAGWGYRDNMLAPLIAPGDSFTVHMKPSSAGSYMYHTHMHNLQLFFGVSGPLIVLNKGENYHPTTDKTFLISQTFDTTTGGRPYIFVNGNPNRDTTQLEKGKTYRLRFMNISLDASDINFSILHNNKPVEWRYISRDGSDLLPNQRLNKPALHQNVTIGQTMDFEFKPDDPGDYTLEVHGFGGNLLLTKTMMIN